MRILKKIGLGNLNLLKIGVIILLSTLLAGTVKAGWFNFNSANKKEERRVEDQQSVYLDSQPIPFFDWSLERHIFIELYKARNNAVKTYSYLRNWQGDIVWSCNSIGFPLAANIQLTNPEAYYSDRGTLPQPEPNGLFSSPSNVGTYVFCINSDGSVSPSYFEDDVETHFSPLINNGRSLETDGTLKIKIKK